MDDYSRIYEEKTAQNNQYDGSTENGAAWLRWTKMYLVGNAPDALTMLNLAESASGTITMEHVMGINRSHSLGVDAVTLAGHIWRYLNQATVKGARAIFENLEIRNGLEAWRRLYRHVHKGSQLQKHTLGMRIQTPASYLKSAGSLSVGVDKWEQDIRDYVAAGGQEPAEDLKIMNLCHALPAALRSNLLWRTSEFHSYQHFKHYVIEQVERLEHFNGKNSVMILQDENEDELNNLMAEKLKDYPEILEALALDRKGRPGMKTAQRSFGGKLQPPRTLPGAPRDRDPKAVGKVRCINCGGAHRSGDCPHPKVDKDKRPCWTCGKPGCIAATCKNKKALQHIGDDDGSQDEEALCVCGGSSDWQPARTRRTGPSPASNRLGDYIQQAMVQPLLGSRERSRVPADEPVPAKPLSSALRGGNVYMKGVTNSFQALMEDNSDDGEDVNEQIENRDDFKKKDERLADQPNNEATSIYEPYTKELDAVDRKILDSFVSNFSVIKARVCAEQEYSEANIFEYEDEPLMPVQEDEVILEVTADTGAVDNVGSEEDFPGFEVQESPGSRKGQHFVGAGAERIKNKGEIKISMEPTDGGKQKLGATFQIADVTRSLMSISKVCDAAPGTTVTFDSQKGVVKRRGRDIATFHRKGGLYVMRVKVKKPKSEDGAGAPAVGFPRQGVKR